MRYHWRNNSVIFLHNLAADAREVRFKAEDAEGPERLLVNLLSDDHSRGDTRGVHTVMLEPYGYRWFRIGGLDYLLKRSEV